MSLRVISGQYRRRLLKTPSDDSTRPYTDRVRQMVFDRLRDYVPDAKVADVFAGVGTMGIECLSRGASSCVFFEGGADIHSLLKLNVQTIAPLSRSICWKVDVRRTSFRPRGGEDCLPYSLVFFDPPYRMANELQLGHPLAASLKRIARPDISTDDCLLIIRTPERSPAPEADGWMVHDLWEMSSMMVWVMVKPDSIHRREFAELQADESDSSIDDEDEADDELPESE